MRPLQGAVNTSALKKIQSSFLDRKRQSVSRQFAQESVSITPNDGVQLEHDGRSIITNAAVNTIVDFGVEGVSNLTKKAAKGAEKKASNAAWNAKDTRNISENRPSSTVRAMKAEKAAIVAQQAREEDVATKIVSQSFDYSKGVVPFHALFS